MWSANYYKIQAFHRYFIHCFDWTHEPSWARGPESQPGSEIQLAVAVVSLTKRFPYVKKVSGLDVVEWWDRNENAWKVFDDMRPHWLVPLSQGRIDQWAKLQYVYHGLNFNGSDDCKFIPHAPLDGRQVITSQKWTLFCLVIVHYGHRFLPALFVYGCRVWPFSLFPFQDSLFFSDPIDYNMQIHTFKKHV